MGEQFFGKLFAGTFVALIVAYVVAFGAIHTPFEIVFTCLAGVLALVLTLKKLEYGLLFALAELVSTSHGHLFSFDLAGFDLSSRMTIFVGVMIGWFVCALRKRTMVFTDPRLPPFFFLMAVVVFGAFVGFTHNVKTDVLKDANAYIYLLYVLPVLSVEWTALTKRQLLQVSAAAVTFVSCLTFFVLYLFTHAGEPVLRATYTFLRDARIAEMTRVVGDIYRIFLQAQFFVLVDVLVLVAAAFWLWKHPENRNTIAYGLLLSLSTLVISLSRSFWIALAVGLLCLFFVIVTVRRPTLKDYVGRAAFGITMFATSIAFVWVILAFPIPPAGNVFAFGSLLTSRTMESDDVAISSRWKLLPAMMEQIHLSPILGSGFGTIVAFETDDPRVRAIYPDGKWRTYAFEWGWHDAWLKMGVFGPIAFLWLGVSLGLGLMRGFKKEHGWLHAGLFAGLVALFVTHVFSPYLNHPIGLGYLVFLLPFIEPKRVQTQEAMQRIGEIIQVRADQLTAPVTRTRT